MATCIHTTFCNVLVGKLVSLPNTKISVTAQCSWIPTQGGLFYGNSSNQTKIRCCFFMLQVNIAGSFTFRYKTKREWQNSSALKSNDFFVSKIAKSTNENIPSSESRALMKFIYWMENHQKNLVILTSKCRFGMRIFAETIRNCTYCRMQVYQVKFHLRSCQSGQTCVTCFSPLLCSSFTLNIFQYILVYMYYIKEYQILCAVFAACTAGWVWLRRLGINNRTVGILWKGHIV